MDILEIQKLFKEIKQELNLSSEDMKQISELASEIFESKEEGDKGE